jgi:hypothetical protein
MALEGSAAGGAQGYPPEPGPGSVALDAAGAHAQDAELSSPSSAIANSVPTPLCNWFAVGNRSGATSGQTAGFIPDGKLCIGNSNYYDFSGFDLASPTGRKPT